MGRNLLDIASTLVLILGASYAAAQNPPSDTLKVDYFINANTGGAPDGTLHLSNPGTTGNNACARLYVFNSNEEISECCSCLLTPNGLRTLSVNDDLTSNPANGVLLTTGTVSIVSSTTVNGQCPLFSSTTPVSGAVRAWATHIDGLVIGGATSSQDATLSTTELQQLVRLCDAIIAIDSGQGICTCGSGD
jgi:hypothetical protein